MTIPLPTPQTFNFEAHQVRTFEKRGEVWFAAKDVCDALALGNSRQAMTRLDDDEKDGVTTNDAMSREQVITVVNESGLYSLILTSRKPEAVRFKRWVTHEVLPAIRTTGTYVDPAAVAAIAEDRLISTRWLVRFNHKGEPEMQILPAKARVVDMADERELTHLMTDEVPVHTLKKMLDAGTSKLVKMLEDYQRLQLRALPHGS